MKTTVFLLMTLFFFSCQNDDQNQQIYGDYIWGASLISEKVNNVVNLKIIDPRPSTLMPHLDQLPLTISMSMFPMTWKPLN